MAETRVRKMVCSHSSFNRHFALRVTVAAIVCHFRPVVGRESGGVFLPDPKGGSGGKHLGSYLCTYSSVGDDFGVVRYF